MATARRSVSVVEEGSATLEASVTEDGMRDIGRVLLGDDGKKHRVNKRIRICRLSTSGEAGLVSTKKMSNMVAWLAGLEVDVADAVRAAIDGGCDGLSKCLEPKFHAMLVRGRGAVLRALSLSDDADVAQFMRRYLDDGEPPVETVRSKRQSPLETFAAQMQTDFVSIECDYYPPGRGTPEDPLDVLRRDFATLYKKEWMCDVVIEVGLQQIYHDLSDFARSRVAMFDPSFFYTMTAIDFNNEPSMAGFDRKFAFVIMHRGPTDVHYSLLVVINGRDILHIDSLPFAAHGDDADLINLVEALQRRLPVDDNTVRVHRIRGTPKQKNSIDCGPFTLTTIGLLCDEIAQDSEDTLADAILGLLPVLCDDGTQHENDPQSSASGDETMPHKKRRFTLSPAALRKRRQDAVAASHEKRPFVVSGARFLTESWFSHSDALDLRQKVANYIIDESRRP